MNQSEEVLIFETERFWVREWRLSDVDAAFEIYRSDRVQHFLAGGRGHQSPDESLRLIERWRNRYALFPGYGFWAMVERTTGTIVGAVALKPLADGREIEVGYHLAEWAWGKGYATEIARGAIRYGFEQMNLDRIVGVCDPANQASFHVLEKTGLIFEEQRFYYGRDLNYLAIDRTRFEAQLAIGVKRNELIAENH